MKKETWQQRTPAEFGKKYETARMYALFQYFLSLPIHQRTTLKVADKFGVSERYVAGIRQRNEWTKRAADFDSNTTVAIQKGATKAAEKAAFDWVAWDIENIEKTRKISDEFYAKAVEILKLPLVQREFKENAVTDADGNQILGKDGKPIYQQITILNPMKFTGSDARAFAEAAVLLSDYAMKRSQGLIPKSINSFLPLPSKDMDEMTPDELAEYAELLNNTAESIVRGETIDVSPTEQ